MARRSAVPRPRVIERRTGSPAGVPEEYEYYVHYEQFNRRLDTWVTIADMDVKTAEQDEDKKKRKAEEAHDEEHAEFDPNALREHEEVTKVRNILKVELGKHEMDTWYFSPFPPEYTTCKKLYFCEFTLNFFKRGAAAAAPAQERDVPSPGRRDLSQRIQGEDHGVLRDRRQEGEDVLPEPLLPRETLLDHKVRRPSRVSPPILPSGEPRPIEHPLRHRVLPSLRLVSISRFPISSPI